MQTGRFRPLSDHQLAPSMFVAGLDAAECVLGIGFPVLDVDPVRRMAVEDARRTITDVIANYVVEIGA